MLRSPLLIRTFLNGGEDRWINIPGVKGCRPLHLAATKHIKVLLIDFEAHLDNVNACGSTSKCCNEHYKSIVKTGELMEQKIDLLLTHVQAFVSLHDSRVTDNEVYCTTRTR